MFCSTFIKSHTHTRTVADKSIPYTKRNSLPFVGVFANNYYIYLLVCRVEYNNILCVSSLYLSTFQKLPQWITIVKITKINRLNKLLDNNSILQKQSKTHQSVRYSLHKLYHLIDYTKRNIIIKSCFDIKKLSVS